MDANMRLEIRAAVRKMEAAERRASRLRAEGKWLRAVPARVAARYWYGFRLAGMRWG